MSTEQLKQAHELLAKIDEAERLQAAYREAGEVVVGIPGKSAHRLGFVEPGHKLTLTADEMGGQIVNAGSLPCERTCASSAWHSQNDFSARTPTAPLATAGLFFLLMCDVPHRYSA